MGIGILISIFCPQHRRGVRIVVAVVAALLVGAASAEAVDTTAPSVPAPVAVGVSSYSWTISWPASTDDVAVTGYKLDVSTESVFDVFVADYNAKDLGNVTNVTVGELLDGTTYHARLRAYDASGNISDYSALLSSATLDVTPPSIPSAVRTAMVSSMSFNVAWTAATDNRGVSGYRLDVSTNAAFLGFVAGYNNKNAGGVVTANVNCLSTGTVYYARLRAYDAAGNISDNSATVSTITLGFPEVTGVSGSVASGGVIQITGQGFGPAGPVVALFDEFVSTYAVEGTTIPLLSPSTGAWAEYGSGSGGVKPVYDSTYHSPPFSMRTFDSGSTRQFHMTFSPTTEVFVSYWLRLPPGTYFPMTAAPYTYPSGSNWKLAWLMDGASGYMGDDDWCIPSWIDGTNWAVGGNDSGRFNFYVGRVNTDQWFTFDGWMRISFWAKAGADPITDLGVMYFQALTEGVKQRGYWKLDKAISDGGINGVPRWTQINFPGWIRSNITENIRPVYDDIYVAVGTAAVARVELGDSSDYSSSTNLHILPAKSWSSGSITADVRLGSFQPGQQAYVFVVDSNGIASNGYPVTVGWDTAPPVKPKGFRLR